MEENKDIHEENLNQETNTAENPETENLSKKVAEQKGQSTDNDGIPF